MLFCFICMQHEKNMSWFNLTAQEIQPMYYHKELEGQGWLRSRGCPEDAWNGGCSLLLEGLIPVSHTSPVCAKCVCVSVHIGGKSDLATSSFQTHNYSCSCTLFLCIYSGSLRIFSIHVPLPSKTLVSFICKPSAGITVSLELKTTDASLGIQEVKREFLTFLLIIYLAIIGGCSLCQLESFSNSYY